MTYVLLPDFTKWIFLDATSGPINLIANDPLVYNSTTHNLDIKQAGMTSSGTVTTAAQTFKGVKAFDSVPTCSTAPTASEGLANKGYVDSVATGLSWQDEVYSFWDMSSPPVPPDVPGRRYIALATVGLFTKDVIYTVSADGMSLIPTVPQEAYAVVITSDTSPLYPNLGCVYNGTNWVNLGTTIVHAALVNLTSDDHLQYWRVSPRTGDVLKVTGPAPGLGLTETYLSDFGVVGVVPRGTFSYMCHDSLPTRAFVLRLSTQYLAIQDDIVTIESQLAAASSVYGGTTMSGGLSVAKNVIAGTSIEALGNVKGLTMTCTSAPVAATDVMRLSDVVPQNWTGFVPGAASQSIITTGGTRDVSIAPTGVSFDFYQAGVKYTKSAISTVTLDNTTGLHYIYFDAGVLSSTMIVNDALFSKVTVALAYYNVATTAFVFLGDERHTYAITPQEHQYEHFSSGTAYMQGITPSNFVIGDGSLNTHAQFATSVGTILDQDLSHSVTAHAVGGSMQVYFLDGTNWNRVASVGAFMTTGTALYYNRLSGGVWNTQTVTAGRFVLGHLVATTDLVGADRLICILGQNQYTSVSAATTGAITEVQGLYTVGLPLYEFVFIATIIYQSDAAYGNAYKGRVVNNTLSPPSPFIDWRQRKLTSAAGTVQSHSSLSGLTADDHPQYPLLTGRTGESITLTNGSLIVNGATQKIVFDNQIARRRIALYTAADNDYQFFGLGIESDTLQFQVPAATNRFSFRQGANSTQDVELMAIESPLASGSVKIFHVTPSTSSITGALLVAGGAGIGENLNVGGNLSAANVTIPSGGQLYFPSYSVVKMLGGNSYGYVQGDYTAFGDGITMQFNQHGVGTVTPVVDNPGGSTSAVECGYGYVALRAGNTGVVASDTAAAFADRFQLYKPLSGGGTTTYFTTLWSNMAATPFTVYLYKLADRVTVYFGNWNSTTDGTAGATSNITLANVIPAGYRPPDLMGQVVLYALAGAFYNGFLQVLANGTIILYSLPRATFTNSVAFVLFGLSFTYPTV